MKQASCLTLVFTTTTSVRKGCLMTLSTICPLLLATPFAASLLELTIELLPLIAKVGLRIVAFRQGAITPAASHAFERDLQELLREMGRVIVQWVYNRLETS